MKRENYDAAAHALHSFVTDSFSFVKLLKNDWWAVSLLKNIESVPGKPFLKSRTPQPPPPPPPFHFDSPQPQLHFKRWSAPGLWKLLSGPWWKKLFSDHLFEKQKQVCDSHLLGSNRNVFVLCGQSREQSPWKHARKLQNISFFYQTNGKIVNARPFPSCLKPPF